MKLFFFFKPVTLKLVLVIIFLIGSFDSFSQAIDSVFIINPDNTYTPFPKPTEMGLPPTCINCGNWGKYVGDYSIDSIPKNDIVTRTGYSNTANYYPIFVSFILTPTNGFETTITDAKLEKNYPPSLELAFAKLVAALNQNQLKFRNGIVNGRAFKLKVYLHFDIGM